MITSPTPPSRIAAGRSRVCCLGTTEMLTEIPDLNETYEPLVPGRYQLSPERRFFKDDIPSNAVMFEVTRGKK